MGLNHVYKVIWNKTKGCYVVVSELAKRVGRNKAKAIVMSTAAMAMAVTPAVMNVDQVEASVLIGNADGTTISANGSTVNSWGITIGGGITNAGSHSVHVGDATLEEGERNVIIGTHATAGVDKIAGRQFVRQSTAIGGGSAPNEGARAFGDQSIAIGANTIAEGNSSIAIGNDDVDKAVNKQLTYTNSEGNKVAGTLGDAYNNLTGKNLLYDGGQYVETRSGEAAVAIGVKAEAKDISVALGTSAKAKAVNTVAIGTGAEATLDNSVAIGGGALVDDKSQGTKQTSTTINGITYKWAGGDATNPGDVVSFGKPGYERQLKNIAAGEISNTSTDAINGSQIHSLVEKITGTPHFSYAGDDASTENVTAGTADEMTRDAEGKKQVVRSIEHGRLNLIGGADKTKLSDNNIGVTYTNGNTLTFKLAKELTGLTSSEFKDANNNVVNITPTGVSVAKPGATADNTVTLGQNGLNNGGNAITNVTSGLENHTEPGKTDLRNLDKNTVSDTTAATVGDLRHMGWVVSSNKTTGTDGAATDTAYSADVKNANEVRFVGKDGAIVSGTTDAATGVRTITVGLDKKAMSGSGASASPVAYTKADGTKVYPVKADNGSVTYHTTPNGEGPNDAVVPGTEVITSVDGPEGTKTPATLTNVAGNLAGAKTGTDTPTTEQAAPTLGTAAGQVNVHNAATVGDVLNAGWNLQNNDAAKDFVKAYDTVNFVNGDGTTAVVETTDNKVSKIKYNVNTGNGLQKDADGNTISVKPGDKSLEVTEAGVAVKKADQSLEVTDAGLKVKTDGTTITAGDNGLTINTGTVNAVEAGDKKGTVEVPTADAGKIATVDTVVKAVNSASFTLKASAGTDGTRNADSAVDENGEQIKAGSTVELVAGKNLEVKHDTNGKITFATKDEVAFNTVQIGGSEGPKLTKTDSGDLKLSDKDGTKPVAITNVKSNLPETKNGAPAEATKAQPVPTLGTEADQVNANNAATVGDVLNAGWNLQNNGEAKDFVKPYDTVNFVDGANTTAVITTSEDGTTSKVTYNVTGLPVSYTTEDGKPVSKVGDKFYKVNEHGQPVSEAGKAAVGTNAEGKLVDADNNVIEAIDTIAAPLKTALVNPTPAADKTGTTSPTALNNVTSGLNKYGDQVDGKPVEGTTPANTGLIDLSTPADGAAPKVSDNTAATVGDLRNMGWIVSADKTTGDLDKAYSATVKNANEVKFVGTGTAIVSGETKDGVRTITVNVDDQVSANNAKTPVVYTKADGTKVYPIKGENGVITYHTTPDGKGDNDQEVPGTEVITSVNSPDGTTTPATLANVAGNLDGAKKDTTAPKAEAAAPNTTNKDGDKYINPNNAATVGDVLNAGWNVQENGTAKDFVKPYDKVNFVNGGNTTAVVTTNAEGTVSNVSFNVTGLPVSYTTEDGKPVSKVGDKFYKVNEQGQPISEAGKPAVGTNAEGKLVDADNNVIEPIDPAATPLKTALVNPTPEADKTGTTSPTALNNVTSGLHKYGDQVDGKPVEGTTPANTGLIDLSTPADGAAPKVSDNTAATVGDLRNMGWIVSADKTTGDLDKAYSATVKNANEVKFVGTGTAIVSGETKDGVRTITVNVDDQVSANNAKTPVVYTKADGTKVYPIKGENGVITYHTTPDGKGDNDQEVPGTEVITSVNSPDGTTTPATLANVAGNLDGAKKDTTAPKAEAAAPNTTNKDGDKYINPNNAATVGDVLNAGWNVQENGTAKDFVKPYDTVNFINGANTTAVVTTSEDGTTSKVTYNVTGLPVSYTTEDGKPVSKVGDKFYKVNEKGQPLAEDGTPAAGTDKDGNPITANGTVIKAIDPTVDPLKTALVNPNPEAGKTGTTAPTQLTNVANGADTFKPANDVKQANDGKWYNASDVEPNGKVKDGAKSVASPVATKNAAGDVLEKGKDGNWYKASDLENGEPKPNVDAQTPVAKPENAEKAGLVNFEGSNPNNAATVGDLQNLGFIVSAADNGYTEQMRNANKVEFKGSNGVSVTGKTLEDGTREITVALKEGRVTNNVIITKADGTEVHGERGEDGKYYQYEKDPVTGQPKKVEVPVVAGDTVTNDGDAYVTGNSVATAIQKSGWNIGIGSTDKAFSEEEKTYEHVNPNDHVKYVNGDNTTVSMAVDPEKDRDGTTVTTTYVKVDVKRDLKIDSLTTGGPAKDKDGNSLQEINGEYYPANAVEKDGKAYPAGTVFIDGKAYPAGSAKDPNTNGVVKDGQPATEVQPLTATPKDKVADGKDGAMTVKDAKGKDGVSATAKDGKGVLTLNNAGTDKDGKDASTVNISTGKAPTDLGNTPKDGSEVPTMDRIQYTDGTGTSYNVATMNDGLRFVGDDDKAIDKTLNSTLTLTGGNREATGKPVAEEATTTGNIGVFNKDGKLSIQLAKDLDKLNSANFESKTDKDGNPLKAVDGKYYPENSVVQEGKVYPEGTVIIDNKPYPAGTTKDAAGNVVNNGKSATEATPIKPIDSTQVQDGPTSKLTGTGLNFNTPAPKDENGNPLILVDGKYYKADNLENGKPKAEAKPEAVKPAQSTAITPDGLAITPDTAKVVDPKTGEVTVDPTKVVSFGAPSIVTDPTTGKAVIDPKTGEPVMKSGISAGGQVMSNVAPGVLDTDAVNVSQLKGVAHNINMRMNRMGAQAAAMASLQSIQYDPLEPTQISAGVGHYKGASALALGVNHFKNESTMFHMGASLNGHGDESMINASVTWKFGGRADETAVKDTFRQGPISASYTLQDKVSALEEQNQILKEQVAELFRRLNEKA